MPSKQEGTHSDDPFNFAPAWRPDQDDVPVLEGEFTNLSEGFSAYGSYPIVVITSTETGEQRAWHAMTQIAKAQLIKATPKLGEMLRISYGGKVQSKTEGREPYHRWRVENLTHPVTVEDILVKYGVEVEANKPSSQFQDELPF